MRSGCTHLMHICPFFSSSIRNDHISILTTRRFRYHGSWPAAPHATHGLAFGMSTRWSSSRHCTISRCSFAKTESWALNTVLCSKANPQRHWLRIPAPLIIAIANICTYFSLTKFFKFFLLPHLQLLTIVNWILT